jgi:hypothetical protein
VAINSPGGGGADPTRGTGPDKVTVAVEPDLEAPPHALDNESASGAADPARGGCMRLGWGCLPVLFILTTPAVLFI